MTTERCELLDREDTAREVEVDDGCPACNYIHQHVRMNAGDVAFVVVGGRHVYRSTCLSSDPHRGKLVLRCFTISREDAMYELAAMKARASKPS